MNNPLGLYIHVPFCRGKCPYCDFYSLLPDREKIEEYTQKICSLLEKAGGIYNTVYFGGGTPTLLGSRRLIRLLKDIQKKYEVAKDAEITLEANPESAGDFRELRALRRLTKSGI